MLRPRCPWPGPPFVSKGAPALVHFAPRSGENPQLSSRNVGENHGKIMGKSWENRALFSRGKHGGKHGRTSVLTTFDRDSTFDANLARMLTYN